MGIKAKAAEMKNKTQEKYYNMKHKGKENQYEAKHSMKEAKEPAYVRPFKSVKHSIKEKTYAMKHRGKEAGYVTKHRTQETGMAAPTAGTQVKLEAKTQKSKLGLWKDQAKAKLFPSRV